MDVTITTSNLKTAIIKEISRFAATAYSEDGSSLYDAYRTTSRDDSTIGNYINLAVDAIVARLSNIATASDNKITFNAPDVDSTNKAIEREVENFITMKSCSLWLEEKGAVEFNKYEARATSALNAINILVKTRKAPTRS